MSQLFVDDVVSKEGTNSVGFSKGVNVSASSTITGNLNVSGVLTYEDVTNIDAVGVVTARSGIKIGAAGIGGTFNANGDTTLAGVVTATSFSGAATGLTGVPGGQITGALAAVDGSALTGMANTANVSTSDLFVVGVSTLTGQANIGSGVTINSTGIEVTSGIITAGTCFKAGGGIWGPGIGATILGSGNVVFAGITSVGSAITMYASSGIVSATAFYGDGSQLEGVSASGGGSSLDITSCLFI